MTHGTPEKREKTQSPNQKHHRHVTSECLGHHLSLEMWFLLELIETYAEGPSTSLLVFPIVEASAPSSQSHPTKASNLTVQSQTRLPQDCQD